MRGDVQGRLGYVTKGEPGDSAYEIAVKHGFTGTEEEWLASLAAEAAPAQSAASLAGAAAARAEDAAEAAEDARDEAETYARAAKNSEDVAYDSRVSAAASARTASTAAESAGTNAAYIQSRINQAVLCADQAAVSDSHATAMKGEAAQSEAKAKQSELMAAEYSVTGRGYVSLAAASASQAEQSATNAAASAVQAATVISNFNANVAQAATYASIAGGYANVAETAAMSATDSANRAEAALGQTLRPLSNYFTKDEVVSIAGGEASLRSAADTSLAGGIVSLQSSLASNYYTKTEINDSLSAIPKFGVTVVGSLPAASVAATDKVYIVPSGSDTDNIYTEYLAIDDGSDVNWEQLGTQALDLSGYETQADIAPYKAKLDSIEAGAQVNTVTGVKGDSETDYRVGNINITAGSIGLGDVDNTHDSVKSVSAASLAGGLDNIDSLGMYAVGDVVFAGNVSPSTCYICVLGIDSSSDTQGGGE